MIRILFVCHGNICRSPMAEFILKDMVSKKRFQDDFLIDSAAVSYEEEGNSIYPPAKRTLEAHRIPIGCHKAHRIEKDDYDKYDLIIGMDESNIQNIYRIIGSDPDKKVHKLLDFTNNPRDISDPWYTRDFECAYKEIYEGVENLLKMAVSK